MTKIISYLLLAIMILNSSYLSYKYFNFYYGGGMLKGFDCTDGCDSVMMSQYSMFFGIPIPVYGLAYFILLAILFHFKQNKFLIPLLVIGCLAALGFLYILYFVLHMTCKFCLLSHISLFLFMVLYCISIVKQENK